MTLRTDLEEEEPRVLENGTIYFPSGVYYLTKPIFEKSKRYVLGPLVVYKSLESK